MKTDFLIENLENPPLTPFLRNHPAGRRIKVRIEEKLRIKRFSN